MKHAIKIKALLIAAAITLLPLAALCAEDTEPALGDVLKRSDLYYRNTTPEFASELDRQAWKTLEGVYIKDGPPASLGTLKLSNTIWGKDYVDFGPETLSVSYRDGEWYFKGADVIEVMQITSSSADGKTFYTLNYWYPLTFRIDGEYLILEEYGMRFYKVTGPDCHMRFLKKYAAEHGL